jgi:SOS response regulatory protein OraA/RecX
LKPQSRRSSTSERGVTPSALDAALGALRHRDLSLFALDERLATRGFSEEERADALETLRRTGLADDGRYAGLRAQALASRGAGDALIRRDLEGSGVARDDADGAIDLLEPELDRARRIVSRRGVGAKTARYLAGKGFAEETIASCAGASCAGPSASEDSADELD